MKPHKLDFRMQICIFYDSSDQIYLMYRYIYHSGSQCKNVSVSWLANFSKTWSKWNFMRVLIRKFHGRLGHITCLLYGGSLLLYAPKPSGEFLYVCQIQQCDSQIFWSYSDLEDQSGTLCTLALGPFFLQGASKFQLQVSQCNFVIVLKSTDKCCHIWVDPDHVGRILTNAIWSRSGMWSV